MATHPPMTVGEIMSRDCYRVTGTTSVATLVTGLARHRLPGIPVVDERDHLVGFISEQDVLAKVLDSAYHDSRPALVHELMRHEVLTVTADKSIVDLAQEMLGNKPKVYPVVNNARLIGIVTRHDVLGALSSGRLKV
ncbi:CBS domain-containing protein [Halomonas sp. WWR20]